MTSLVTVKTQRSIDRQNLDIATDGRGATESRTPARRRVSGLVDETTSYLCTAIIGLNRPEIKLHSHSGGRCTCPVRVGAGFGSWQVRTVATGSCMIVNPALTKAPAGARDG